MSQCYSCRTELLREKVFRSTVCPNCGKGVRVCLNCKFYTPGSHWDCRETISELVRDKDIVNFCDFFSTSEAARSKAARAEPDAQRDDVRSVFDKLFDD